jgi:hypothetical protein
MGENVKGSVGCSRTHPRKHPGWAENSEIMRRNLLPLGGGGGEDNKQELLLLVRCICLYTTRIFTLQWPVVVGKVTLRESDDATLFKARTTRTRAIWRSATTFLGTLVTLREATISFLMFVGPHAATRLSVDGFSWGLVFEDSSKIWIWLKSDKNNRHFTWRPVYKVQPRTGHEGLEEK